MSSAATWPLRDAARASGTKARVLGQWLATGVLKLTDRDVRSTGSGVRVGLSRQRILQVAITRHLVLQGVTVSKAVCAAAKFTDEYQKGRLPGELFPDGRTYLVARGGNWTVMQCPFDASYTALSDFEPTIIAVDLNRVVDDVDNNLIQRKIP